MSFFFFFFFFQAEDGIRYLTVTGVQTCALPISESATYTVPVQFAAMERHATNRLDASSNPTPPPKPGPIHAGGPPALTGAENVRPESLQTEAHVSVEFPHVAEQPRAPVSAAHEIANNPLGEAATEGSGRRPQGSGWSTRVRFPQVRPPSWEAIAASRRALATSVWNPTTRESEIAATCGRAPVVPFGRRSAGAVQFPPLSREVEPTRGPRRANHGSSTGPQTTWIASVTASTARDAGAGSLPRVATTAHESPPSEDRPTIGPHPGT